MSEQVITYHHSRKGPVTGVKIWEDDEWMKVRIVGEQELRYASITQRLAGPHPDGDVVTLRKSLISFETAATPVTTIPAPPLALRLADLLGATWDGEALHLDGHVLTCRPNGDVVLDGGVLLGRFSDGADLLAAKCRMEVAA